MNKGKLEDDEINKECITLMDSKQTIKRRASFEKGRNAKPILTTRTAFNKNNNRQISKWFKDKSVEGIQAHHIQQAMSMQNQQIEYLCCVFNIEPKTHRGFQNFLLSIKKNEIEKANTVNQAMKLMKEVNIEQLSIEQFNHLLNQNGKKEENERTILKQVSDFQYETVEIVHDVLIDKSINLDISDLNIDGKQRLVIQYFSNERGLCFWPNDVSILINNSVVLSGTTLNNDFIDISDLNPKIIKIVCEENKSRLIVKKMIFHSYCEIIQKMNKISEKDEDFQKYSTSIFDPIFGGIMKYPGKGIYCKHQQCFDLKSFLIKANITKNFICPICMQNTPISELVFSSYIKNYIESIKKNNVKVITNDFIFDEIIQNDDF